MTASTHTENQDRRAAWLWVAPDPFPHPPISTRIQDLPLNELTWPDFQRLCARLAQEQGDVEFSQEYGLPGQKQEGIDVYIRRHHSAKYVIWQCKRYQDITACVVKNAVDTFLAGDWVSRSDEFALCATCAIEDTKLADEIERQSERLKTYGITFTPFGTTQLSGLLKRHVELIDDFFGREWVRSFCGEEAADGLGLQKRKLRPSQIADYRRLLRQCYLQHFESVDPGLPSLTNPMARGPAPFPLVDRYVLPDVLVTRERTEESDNRPGPDMGRPTDTPIPAGTSSDSPALSANRSRRVATVTDDVRRPAIAWIAEEDCSIILGDPGMGKSALLRYMVLDLLSPMPRHEDVALKWGHRLPVWIPFAMWVRLVAENEIDCSLSDLLRGWLRKVSAPSQLESLVQEAIEDSRLLLFVDGLDEWNNETAARTTVALLEQFVAERSIPALAVCRPLGFQRLGGLTSKWRRGRLAGMNRKQQMDLAYRWFLHQQRTLTEHQKCGYNPTTDFDRYAQSHANNLIHEIQQDSQLARLAETPLLMSGLIALSAQQVQLPRSRFRAYEELTKLLLQEQPRRREKASHSREPTTSINADTRQLALAFLAHEIHKSPDSVSLDRHEAIVRLQSFFTKAFFKQPDVAHQWAEMLIAVSADTIGVLVEKSHDEIGFLHRTFQEYLTACHLRRMPFVDVRAYARAFAEQPSWYNVFLCFCYLNDRADENSLLVKDIEELEVSPEVAMGRICLLSELVFAGICCTPDTALRLADCAFAEIEQGYWLPMRKRLLGHALDGLHCDILQKRVADQLGTWYPARHSYRSGVFEAIASWPREDVTTEMLWRGLMDEEEWTQRAASEALAKYAVGAADIGRRLLKLIRTPTEPRVSAYALHSLCLGWSGEASVSGLLEVARKSPEILIQMVATYHRVFRGKTDENDKQFLLEVGNRQAHAPYHWREDAAKALAKGWPADHSIKKAALTALTDRDFQHRSMEPEFAATYLFEAYPQDDEVATVIGDIFRTEEYPTHRFSSGNEWKELVRAFAGHRLLQEPIDEWFDKHGKVLGHDACLVSRSDRAKQALMELPNTTGIFGGTIPVRTLIQGWGINDDQTRKLLISLSNDAEVAPFVADLLPLVIPDTVKCRQRLIEYIRDQPKHVAWLALSGFLTLPRRPDDEEVADMALQKWADQDPSEAFLSGDTYLIRGFPTHPQVRDLAIRHVRSKGGHISVVASVYREDAEMRSVIRSVMTPLPSPLRQTLVEWLSRQAAEDAFAHDLLSQYDDDTGEEVKTAAAIAYARSSLDSGSDLKDLLNSLAKRVCAVGPDYHERRQAAFAALIEVGHLEVIAEGREPYDKEKPLRVTLGHDAWDINIPLAQQIAQHWEEISQAFDHRFWDRTEWASNEMWEEIVRNAENAQSRQEIVAHLCEREGRMKINVSTVRMLSKEWQGSKRLREKCMELIQNYRESSYADTAPAVLAAETIGMQFADDSTLRTDIDKLVDVRITPDPSVAIIALCEGWPDCDALRQVSHRIQDTGSLLLPAQIHLIASCDSAETFVTRLGKNLQVLRGDIWEFIPSYLRAVQARFLRDSSVRDIAFSRLEAGAPPAEILNFAVLLHRTDHRLKRLQQICTAELSNQCAKNDLPDLALDLSVGCVRPIAHALLEILQPFG